MISGVSTLHKARPGNSYGISKIQATMITMMIIPRLYAVMAVLFVIDGKGYIALGQTSSSSLRSNYWIYDPATDLWDGEDLTDFEGSSRVKAVCFSTGKRGIVATGGTGTSSSSFYDDTWELKPYEYEEKIKSG